MTDDNISRLAAEKAIHKAIADERLINGKTSAGQYSAVAVKAIRALPRQPQTDALEVEIGRLTDLLRRVVNLAEAYATGTGEAFNNTIAEARTALKESK